MGLKVVKLVAENVKGLKAVEIVPDENFQIIAGKNGQGKTSVLDTIMLALGGGSASKGLAKPLEVKWLCNQHHKKVHSIQREAKVSLGEAYDFLFEKENEIYDEIYKDYI